MTISADNVCTHQELADEIGGLVFLENLLPREWGASTLAVREQALRDVLESLRRRTPPVREGDLYDVTELRNAVAFGALERIYRAASPSADSVYEVRRKGYEMRFQAECLGMMPTLNGDGVRGSVFSISVDRR